MSGDGVSGALRRVRHSIGAVLALLLAVIMALLVVIRCGTGGAMSRGRRLLSTLLVLLVGLTAALVVVTRDNDTSQVSAVRSVAAVGVTRFFGLDHRDPEKSVDRVVALTTGRFRTEYRSQRDTIVASIKQRKLRVDASVPEDGVAIVRLDPRRATVLVAADIRSRSVDGSEERSYRTKVSLTRVAGDWLIDDLKQVG